MPYRPDLGELCHPDPRRPEPAWRISPGLDPGVRASRFARPPEPGPQAAGLRDAVRVSVHPGDAADPNPGGKPTERAEAQLRRTLVRFDEPVWYRFRFRLVAGWGGVGIGNRTVIHQIKQDIAPHRRPPHGPCPPANPFLKLEAEPTAEGAVFLVKVRGTDDCCDGSWARVIGGPLPLAPASWYGVHILLRASQVEGRTVLRVWLDGRPCARHHGRLGYSADGMRDTAGRPVVNAQPRFGIYRDALPDLVQVIDFADLVFWSDDPAGGPCWDLPPGCAALPRPQPQPEPEPA